MVLSKKNGSFKNYYCFTLLIFYISSVLISHSLFHYTLSVKNMVAQVKFVL